MPVFGFDGYLVRKRKSVVDGKGQAMIHAQPRVPAPRCARDLTGNAEPRSCRGHCTMIELCLALKLLLRGLDTLEWLSSQHHPPQNFSMYALLFNHVPEHVL